MKTTYSVIIPTRNEEKTIGLLLSDLKKQSIKPNQIIVADASNDQTPNIAEKMGAIVTTGNNEGFVGKARNNGAKLATGDFLIFFDADVRLENETLIENVLNYMQEKNLDISSLYFKVSNQSLLTKSYMFLNALRKVVSSVNVPFLECGQSIFIKKSVFDQINGFDEKMRNSEDVDLFSRTIKTGAKYKIAPYQIYTSSRRFENKSTKQVVKLGITMAGITAFYMLGRKIFEKHADQAYKTYDDARDYN